MPEQFTCRLLLTFRTALFTVSLLACLPTVFCQPENSFADFNPRFEVFTLPGGTQGNRVQGIVQDSVGLLWFGSQEGLHRYDGQGFVSYRHDPLNPNSLASDYIESIIVDRSGVLWMTHFEEGGITAFDPDTEIFTRYFTNTEYPENADENTFSVLVEDQQDYIWVGGQAGLLRLDRKTGKFKRFKHDPANSSSLSNDRVRALYVDRQGTLWVGTGFPWDEADPDRKLGGLNRYDASTESFTRYLHDPTNPQSLAHNKVRALYEDSKGNFWVGTGGDGLHRMNRQTGKFERLTSDPTHPEKLSRPWLNNLTPAAHDPSSHVTSILEDYEGRIWITARPGGLNVFDPATNKLLHFEAGTGSGDLTTNFLWQAFQSRDGTMWIIGAGDAEIVFKVKQQDALIPVYPVPAPPNVPDWFSHGIVKDQAGTIWVAQEYAELMPARLLRIDPKTGTSQAVTFSDSVRRIFSISLDLEGKMWVGTDLGHFRGDPLSGSFTQIRLKGVPDSILQDIWMPVLHKSTGQFWFGSWNHGLFRYDPKTGETVNFRHDPDKPGSIGGNRLWGVNEDEKGDLWVGGGSPFGETHLPIFLDRFQPETNTFEHFIKGQKRTGWAACINSDKAGNIWFVNWNNGIQKLNPVTGDIKRFTQLNSALPTNFIFAMVRSKEGKLWLAGENHLVELDPETENISVFSTGHGILPAKDFYNSASASPDGELLFSRMGGFHAFNPEQLFLRKNKRPPDLHITGFTLLGERLKKGSQSVLEKPIWQTSAIRLDYDQNVFGFSVACFDFNDPASVQIQFKLEGYDKKWRNDLRNGETPSYVNVPPGDYTFRLRGADSHGGWNEEGVRLKIRILPPWWKTWWAFTIYGLLFLTSIFFFDRFQRQRIVQRERRRMLEREVAQAKEIEKAYGELQQKNRQLEIEAALERVRTQAMSMHQSNDLLNVITVVGVELHQIGIPFDWVNILTDVKAKEGLTAWQTVLGLQAPLRVFVPYIDHVLFNTLEELSPNKVDHWNYTLMGEELKLWFEHVFKNTAFKNLPEEIKQKRLSAKRGDLSFVALKNKVFLSLAIHDGAPYTEEQNNIIKRFGKVFEQAYTRFLDLQKAEALAEQAHLDLVKIQTEKQRAEDALTELRATQSQLIQSEKLASLGELTAGIAHEIQNPLNFVNNFSELSVDLANEINEELEKEPVDKALVKELMGDLAQNQQKINHHGKRASSIVTGMLQHARTSTGRKEPADLNALADEFLRLSYHGLRAKDSTFNAKMVSDFDPAVGKVEVIPQDIGRVLLNLMNNAFYAVMQRSKQAENGYEPTVTISSKRRSDGVEVRIQDNGTGIPESVKAKIFQPFFTTKPTGQGTGLGLSLAYDIVTKGHGGKLEVKTQENQGTEFILHLPT